MGIDISLKFLGSPRIEDAGSIVEMDTRKATALLAYLSVVGELHTRDAIANLLWPDYPEQGAKGALRRTLSTIRKALGERVLETVRDQIKLADEVSAKADMNQFRQRIQTVKNHHNPSEVHCHDCQELLLDAANLYRGDFLEGFNLRDSQNFDEWQFYQAESLRSDYAWLLEKLGQSFRIASDFEQARVFVQRWLALDPLVEAAHRELMLIYHEMGQRSAALRQYRECAKILDEELGVSPLEETTLLYHQILEDKVPGWRAYENQALVHAQEASPTGRLKKEHLPLVGREYQWQELVKIIGDGFGRGHFLALTGEAGIGKSRLAEEYLEYLRGVGITTAGARCFAGETDLAYAPFIQILQGLLNQPQRAARLKSISVQWLREAARLVPEIAAHVPERPAPATVSAGGRGQFYEGLRQVLISFSAPKAPLAIFIDDLHLADQATLDFLSYLVRRVESAPLLIITTWRDGDGSSDRGIRQLTSEMAKTEYGKVIPVYRLSEGEVALFVEALPEIEADEDFTRRLFQETEGIPFLLVEYISMLLREKARIHASDWSMPDRVRSYLQTTVNDLEEAERQLLQTAAVIGHSFDYDVLQSASGRSEVEVMQAVEVLTAKGIIRERHPQADMDQLTYEFGQQKVRDLVYSETSQPRLRLLHRRIAETLVNQSFGVRQRSQNAKRIAYHYQMGGTAPEAAHYYKIAGDYAQSIFANADALKHYQSALSMNHPDRGELHERIGDLHVLMGVYQEALKSLETALALSKQPTDVIRIQQKIGEVYDRRGDWELAQKYIESALSTIDENEMDQERPRVYASLSRSAFHAGNHNRAMQLAQQALNFVHEQTDDEAHSLVHNILGILFRRTGDNDLAYYHLCESLKAEHESLHPAQKIAVLNNLGLVQNERGQPDDAIRFFQEAMKLCEQIGDLHRTAAIHNNLADLFNALGENDEAMLHLKRAVALFSEVGQEDDYPRPEIWMLMEW
jgi:DNA-binding SARP family transcriptional activator/Flp pilus assembly protein TadD